MDTANQNAILDTIEYAILDTIEVLKMRSQRVGVSPHLMQAENSIARMNPVRCPFSNEVFSNLSDK